MTTADQLDRSTAGDPASPPDETRDTAVARSTRADVRRAGGAVLGLVLLLTGMLALFAWPAVTSAPRDLPIGVAGPAPAVQEISGALSSAQPDAFAVTGYPTRDAAVAAIERREVYGAIVVGPNGAEVLTASAASPTVAQLLDQLGGTLAARQGVSVTTTDVVPLPPADPRGAGLGAGLLPIVLGGLATAGVMTALVRRRWLRVVGALTFSVVGGLALAWVLTALGTLEANYLGSAATLALGIAAVSLTVLGAEALLGFAGIGLGALVMMLFGNALSGAQSAPEMLPRGWSAVGQWLPPGATAQLLRSVAFFDGNGGWPHVVVLLCWLAFGLLLLVVAGARARRRAAVATRPVPAPAT